MVFSLPPWISVLLLLLLGLLVQVTEGVVQCYYPDGSIPTDYTVSAPLTLLFPSSSYRLTAQFPIPILIRSDPFPQWVPCTSRTNSACCVPAEGDICQSNGLCYYPPNKALFRGACTDPTWQAPECPQICLSGGSTSLLLSVYPSIQPIQLYGSN
jgi:hypothetical protein